MNRAHLFLSLFVLSYAPLARSEGITPGSYPEREAAWKKFQVRDVEIGTRIDKLKAEGFTCFERKGNFPYCAKVLDPKCKGRQTKVKMINFSSDIPAGHVCTVTFSSGSVSTYLDQKHTDSPMSVILAEGTDTDVPRVEEIRYIFAKDVLTEESNIGKALIAKYGPPASSSPPNQMDWSASAGLSDFTFYAGCGQTVGPTGEYCEITVRDQNLLDSERSIQKEYDDQRTLKSGPAAPKL